MLIKHASSNVEIETCDDWVRISTPLPTGYNIVLSKENAITMAKFILNEMEE